MLLICVVYTCSNFLDHKVVGCPIHISLDYMKRNVLIFNLCFVFDAAVKTARYELVLKKVANYLKALEVFMLLSFYLWICTVWSFCRLDASKTDGRLVEIVQDYRRDLQFSSRRHLLLCLNSSCVVMYEKCCNVCWQLECQFISNSEVKGRSLPTILSQMLHDLNNYGECHIPVSK